VFTSLGIKGAQKYANERWGVIAFFAIDFETGDNHGIGENGEDGQNGENISTFNTLQGKSPTSFSKAFTYLEAFIVARETWLSSSIWNNSSVALSRW
jgi:hypothetical protein